MTRPSKTFVVATLVAMMRHATKVPNNTVFFMSNGQLYSTSGTLDPTGNFYRP